MLVGRMRLMVTVALMLALTLAVSGTALAQPGGGDVCVSIKGDTKVDRGESECFSDPTSKAVVVNDSLAFAVDDSRAGATNDSLAAAGDDSRARATNGSRAFAEDDCNASANNGERERCP